MPRVCCTGLVISRDQNLAVRLPDKARLVAVESRHTFADCRQCDAQGAPEPQSGCFFGEQVESRVCIREARSDRRPIHWVLAAG